MGNWLTCANAVTFQPGELNVLSMNMKVLHILYHLGPPSAQNRQVRQCDFSTTSPCPARWGTRLRYLFNGDMVDRGSQAMESGFFSFGTTASFHHCPRVLRSCSPSFPSSLRTMRTCLSQPLTHLSGPFSQFSAKLYQTGEFRSLIAQRNRFEQRCLDHHQPLQRTLEVNHPSPWEP